jgi:hypothetical protein
MAVGGCTESFAVIRQQSYVKKLINAAPFIRICYNDIYIPLHRVFSRWRVETLWYFNASNKMRGCKVTLQMHTAILLLLNVISVLQDLTNK